MVEHVRYNSVKEFVTAYIYIHTHMLLINLLNLLNLLYVYRLCMYVYTYILRPN